MRKCHTVLDSSLKRPRESKVLPHGGAAECETTRDRCCLDYWVHLFPQWQTG